MSTTVADRLWSRLAAITASILSTRSRLAEESAAWEVAKETLTDRRETFTTAQDEAAEKHPEDLPAPEWKKLKGLHDDLSRAQTAFDLADRAKRRDEKFIKDQERKAMDLCAETFGDPDKLDFAGAAAGRTVAGPAWEAVVLADVIGDMFAPHYSPLGILTVRHAKDALEGTLVKQAVIDEKLTKQQADFLRNEVIRFLDSRAVEHKLGKGRKAVEIPEPAKEAKPGAPIAAGDPAAFADGGEIGVKEWDAFTAYCGAAAIASSKPVEKLVKVGERHFVCVAVQPDGEGRYAVGAEATPRKEFEKAHKKNVVRTEPDVQEGPEQYAGVLIAGPRGEYVLGKSLRFVPPAE